MNEYAEKIRSQPDFLPQSPEDRALDDTLAIGAVGAAVSRHAGTLERVYTPGGPVDQQQGKDLTGVRRVVLTGGALIYAGDAQGIWDAAMGMQPPSSLCPRNAKAVVDRKYMLSAMGLLAGVEPEAAMTIMMEELGKDKGNAAGE